MLSQFLKRKTIICRIHVLFEGIKTALLEYKPNTMFSESYDIIPNGNKPAIHFKAEKVK